jgi:hypothetical protein
LASERQVSVVDFDFVFEINDSRCPEEDDAGSLCVTRRAQAARTRVVQVVNEQHFAMAAARRVRAEAFSAREGGNRNGTRKAGRVEKQKPQADDCKSHRVEIACLQIKAIEKWFSPKVYPRDLRVVAQVSNLLYRRFPIG